MEKIEFKSQICTTKEQSKRLLKLGLKNETADMVYHYTNSCSEAMRWELRPYPPTLRHTTHLNVDKLNVFKHKKPDGSIMTGEEYFQELWGKDIPAWSLHRLMVLLDKGDVIGTGVYINYMNVEECYEVVISHIANLLRVGAFDEDYLEEKK